MKKTPAQKIRDYLKLPKRDAFIKKQEEIHGILRKRYR